MPGVAIVVCAVGSVIHVPVTCLWWRGRVVLVVLSVHGHRRLVSVMVLAVPFVTSGIVSCHWLMVVEAGMPNAGTTRCRPSWERSPCSFQRA